MSGLLKNAPDYNNLTHRNGNVTHPEPSLLGWLSCMLHVRRKDYPARNIAAPSALNQAKACLARRYREPEQFGGLKLWPVLLLCRFSLVNPAWLATSQKSASS